MSVIVLLLPQLGTQSMCLCYATPPWSEWSENAYTTDSDDVDLANAEGLETGVRAFTAEAIFKCSQEKIYGTFTPFDA